MNRYDARKLADTITNEQLETMLNRAKTEIKDWTKVSKVNRNLTMGTAWNILGSNFDVNIKYHVLSKTNMIREFGEFLPDDLKPKRKKKSVSSNIIHQDPIF